ncbi:hypothetical protein Tco_1221127 [Tanacetum coccineum]
MLAFQIYLTVNLRFPFDLGFEICCGSLVVYYYDYLIGVPSRLWAVVCTCVDNDGSRILMGNNASIKMGLAAMVDVVQVATTSPCYEADVVLMPLIWTCPNVVLGSD